MKKKFVFGVSLLSCGILIALNINFIGVKASNDYNLVEVTVEACGLSGFNKTTVELTKEHYQILEQYLVRFREQLNKMTTKEEAITLFKEVMIELDKYGLLPKGMDVIQAQKFVSGEQFKTKQENLLKKIIQNENSKRSFDIINLLCYFYAHTSFAFEDTIWVLIALLCQHIGSKYDLKLLSFLDTLLQQYSHYTPFRCMNRVWVAGPGIGGTTYSYFTVGLLGIRFGSDEFRTAYGFSGIKLILAGNYKAMYFGSALMVTT